MAKKEKPNNMVYIMQISASDYESARNTVEDQKVTPKNLPINKNYLYLGTMPDSVELRYIRQQFPKEFFLHTNKSKKQVWRTNCIIDIVFDKPYKIEIDNETVAYVSRDGKSVEEKPAKKTQTKVTELRKAFYTKGFSLWIDEKEHKYVFYLRGSSKVKEGHCLFIDEQYADQMSQWGFMGLNFTHDTSCNMISLFAYRSLTTSGIIGSVKIEPYEILLIADHAPAFKCLASVTDYNQTSDTVYTSDTEITLEQELFDGQSLLDVSKFVGDFEGKGCILLRNKFFKSCAFNTNIQLWFDDKGISTVTDMFGVEHKTSDIKMITTPNSLKALKFAYKAPLDGPTDSRSNKHWMYDYWLTHIDCDFGIVKHEKQTHIKCPDEKVRQQMSYQMVNSLPLTPIQILFLCEYNIIQIINIGSDFECYKNYLGEPHYNKNGDIALSALCSVNPNVQYTEFYSKSRTETIRTLKKRMKQGKIIVEGDNCIMVANPIDMLRCACGEKLAEREPTGELYYNVYTPLFADGEELAGFRSPHIASGNVCAFRNCQNEKYDTYLNLTPNIVVMDAYKSDVMQRLQGADTDSDFVLITNNKVVVDAAKKCMESFLTPINQIKDKKEAPPAYSMETLATKDSSMANHIIGDICNLGQIYNSYYWDEFNSNNPNEQKLKQIYNYISRLSSMSQIAIDRAKKTFAINPRREWDKLSKDPMIQRREELRPSNILTRKTDEETQSLIAHVKALQAELTQAEEAAETLDPVAKRLALRNAWKKYNMEKDELLQVKVKKQVKPLFFKDNSVDNGCIFEHFKTPMDYVYDVVEQFPDPKRRPKTIDFWELLIPAPKNNAQSEIKNDVVMAAHSLRQRQQMYQKMKKAAYESQNTDDYEKMKENIQSVFEETVLYIRSKKMSQATMYNLICRAYGKQTGALKRDVNLIDCDTKKLLLNLLAAAHPDLFYSCFKHETDLVQA